MELVIILLTVVAGVFGGIASTRRDEFTRFMFVMVFGTICIILGASVRFYVDTRNRKSEITPIEVYRGNTELVISSRISEQGDTIKCDSTVVWKHQ